MLSTNRGFGPQDSCYKNLLWTCLRRMSDDDKTLFFAFVTGSTGESRWEHNGFDKKSHHSCWCVLHSAYPPGGCSLTILLRTGDRDHELLPVVRTLEKAYSRCLKTYQTLQSHTCAKQLDISRYRSADEMERKLRLAITQQGFQLTWPQIEVNLSGLKTTGNRLRNNRMTGDNAILILKWIYYVPYYVPVS